MSYKFPRKPSRLWLEPKFKQVVWFVSFLFLGMAIFDKAFPIPALAVIAIGVLGAIPYKKAPGYVLLNRKLISLMMKSDDGKVHETKLKDTLYVTDHPKRTRAAFQGVSMVSVPVSDGTKVSQLGLVHEAKTNIDTCFTAGEGWGAAAISTDTGRMLVDGAFVGALKRVVNISKVPITAALVFLVRPSDDSEAVAYLGRRWDENVAMVDELPPEEVNPVDKRIHDLTIKRMEEIYEQTSQVTMAIAVSMPRPRTWNKKLSALPIEVIARAPVVEATRLLAQDLAISGVQNVQRFSLFKLNAFLKAVFSIDLAQFYADQAEDIRREREGELKNLSDAMTLARGPFPTQMYAHNDGLECDTTFHRYFWISNFDADEVPSDFFEALFNIDGLCYMISLFVETVPASREMKRTGFRRKMISRKNSALLGDQEDPRAEGEEMEVKQQHESLYQSRSAGTRTRLMITISESTFERSSYAVGVIDSVCRSLQMTMEPYLGEAYQVEAAFAGIGVVLPTP